MKKIFFAVCLLCLISATGCHDLVAPDLSDYNDTGLDDSGQVDSDEKYDTDVDQSDAPSADIDEDTGQIDVDQNCVPALFQCSDTACGLQFDTCKNAVNCSPCGCRTPTTPTKCGLADLGINTQCGGEDTKTKCDIPEIPGLTEDRLAKSSPLLYVAQDIGNDDNEGTIQAPFATIQRALAIALNSTIVEDGQSRSQIIAIIVAGGNETVYKTSTLEIQSGVSLIAGYDSQFIRARLNRPTIKVGRVDGQTDKPVFGLIADNIEDETMIHGFHITTDDATNGNSTYAIYANDTDKLILDNISTRAGKGGNGANGSVGEDGAVGGNGENSSWTGLTSTFGNGSKNPGCAAAEIQGGHGGQGYQLIGNSAAKAGSKAEKAPGGAAGVKNDLNGYGKPGGDAPFTKPSANNGKRGESAGDVVDKKWLASGNGTAAENGIHGTGGGGGGGAIRNTNGGNGISGAGGGSGGCAGIGGGGGKVGGGSFGLFLIGSDIEINDSTFQASSGGKGGDGGKAGTAGAGGKGGESARDREPYGGAGGKGSAGTDGGHGGAGAGGVSYGAFCHESKPDTEGYVVYKAGTSAPGGKGPTPAETGGAGITKNAGGCE